jgi:UDP-2-acetamido-3-amino-2,3-dideoxy-glucuronate N-acetyltransferase
MIGAGAVVTKDVPDFALILGNPGKIVGWVDKKGSPLEYDNNGLSQCGQFQFDGKIVSILEDS